MAGATCLEAMARTIEDNIVPLILPFVTQVRDRQTVTERKGQTGSVRERERTSGREREK